MQQLWRGPRFLIPVPKFLAPCIGPKGLGVGSQVPLALQLWFSLSRGFLEPSLLKFYPERVSCHHLVSQPSEAFFFLQKTHFVPSELSHECQDFGQIKVWSSRARQINGRDITLGSGR